MDNLAKEQRKFSRMVKGSANWEKQKLKIAKLHQKAANIRCDYQQKSTTMISNNHALIVVEDLKVANMSKSAKGSAEQHVDSSRTASGGAFPPISVNIRECLPFRLQTGVEFGLTILGYRND